MEDQEAREIRNSLINQLPKQCTEIANNFFDCIEDQTAKEISIRGNSENISYEELEQIMNGKSIPICSAKYDVEKCFTENSK